MPRSWNIYIIASNPSPKYSNPPLSSTLTPLWNIYIIAMVVDRMPGGVGLEYLAGWG